MVRHVVNMLEDLGTLVVCEGVETYAEFDILQDLGVKLFHGYLFAKPAIERLPAPQWPN